MSQTQADLARRVMRSCAHATLATAQRDADGWPSASLVLVALDHDATPILLISRLAEHTRNIEQDSRVSLLFDGTSESDDPLSGPRVTVFGRAMPSALEGQRERFLARHPEAALYAGFADFSVFSIAVERAHLVAGFGRIHWLEGGSLLLPSAEVDPLRRSERGIVTHMNDDHADAIDLYASALLEQQGLGWRMTGIDPEGCDLRLGARTVRLEFAGRIGSAAEARKELIARVEAARRKQQGHPAG